MKNNKLYNILDLVEEIEMVDKMLELHANDSELMYSQYQHKKLKLTNILIKELLESNKDNSDVMYLITKFVAKFYKKELANRSPINDNSDFRKLEEVFS